MAVTTVAACPGCAKKFKVRAELAGKKIRCPGCGEAFTVKAVVDRGGAERTGADKKPAARPPAKTAPAPQPARPAPPPPDDELNDDNPNPYGVTTLDIAPRCPHCANEMESPDALICLYCGYNTQTRTLGSTRKVVALSFGEHFAHLLPGLLCLVGILFLILLHLFYCLTVPSLVRDAWTYWLDHESLRLWIGSIFLGIIWGLGIFMYRRLILEPKPAEKLKD
jgi:DNA-directed RNA polymerase subunit RPC12/RpoP